MRIRYILKLMLDDIFQKKIMIILPVDLQSLVIMVPLFLQEEMLPDIWVAWVQYTVIRMSMYKAISILIQATEVVSAYTKMKIPEMLN